jgi:MFS family permease
MAVLGVASLSPAFPTVQRHFGVTLEQVGWLVTVFTVPGVVLTPVLGMLADRLGRKRILVPSLFLFALAGGACALAPSFGWLLALRTAQGTGAAALGSLNVTLIGDLFAPARRGAAMGYNASVLSVGTATYPAVGGALTLLGWQYPFLLPLLGFPIGLIVLLWLEEPKIHREGSLRLYLQAVARGLAQRRIVALYFGSAAVFIPLYGSYVTYLPFLLEARCSAGPELIGIVFSAASVSTALVSWQLGRLTRLVPEPTLIALSFALSAVALALVPQGDTALTISLPIVLFGAATGLGLPAMSTLLAGSAPPELRGAIMSVNGTVLRLGQTLGPLLMGWAYTVGGLDLVYYAGAGVALGTLPLMIALLGLRRVTF